MDYLLYFVGFLGGVLAGSINTLAGNGSSITLYLLMDVFALPPTVANASNRLGMVTQGLGSLPTYYRNGNLNFRRDGAMLTLMTIGAIIGVVVAINTDEAYFRSVFKYMMLLMLGVILVKPEKWLRKTEDHRSLSAWIIYPVSLILGFYGGFIQMGMGVFLLMFLVLGAKYSLLDGNAIKNAATVLYTTICIGIFAYFGLIDWWFGGLLAAGQFVGGFLGVRFATRYKNANIWTYRILVTVVLLALLKLFIIG
jgi:uncharacterized protein